MYLSININEKLDLFNKLKEKILAFKDINLNHIDFDLPNDIAIENSYNSLLYLISSKNIKPDMINISPEGGIIFEFFNSNKYYMLEFYNDADIVYLERDNTLNQRRVYDFAIEKKENYLDLIYNVS